MAMSFEDFGNACNNALDPNSNGLSDLLDPAKNGLNNSINQSREQMNQQAQDIQNQINKTNQDIQNQVDKTNQDIKNQVDKTNQEIKDTITKDNIEKVIKDAGEIVKTGTDQISNIATGNLQNMIKGVTSGTGLSANMVLVACVIGGIVVLKTIQNK